MRPAQLRQSICTAVLCIVGGLVHAVEPTGGARSSLERTGLTVSSSSGLSLDSSNAVLVPSTQTMVWSRLRQVGVGIGVEQRLQIEPAAFAELNATSRGSALLTLGVSVPTGAGARLGWQTQWPPPQRADNGLTSERRPGFSLTQRDPVAALRAGSLFKARLSEQTVITLRPRRGRAVVTLQHRW